MSRRRLCSAFCLLACLVAGLAGCGTTKSTSATDQLLLSSAIDRTVAAIDFRPLSGQKVYFDIEYILRVKTPVPSNVAPGTGFANPDYLISSIRQQMMAAGCLLQDKKEDADYVVEVRIGTLGADGHEVTYGVPANNLLNAAASFVPGAPSVPTVPEIAFAKRNDQMAAAKVAVFAYDRVTREPVWQSGLSEARSTARATWLLGAGPFQQGAIYHGTQFAGQELLAGDEDNDGHKRSALTDYYNAALFVPAHKPDNPTPAPAVQPASAEETKDAVKPAGGS